MLKAIGFWAMRASEARYYPREMQDLPHPQSLIDVAWEQGDRENIVRYLRSGVRWNEYLGFSWCRIAGGPPPEEMGTADLCDGVWLWPEGLHVYVGRFHVRLPDEFVAHMRENRFTVPNELAKKTFPEHDVDLSFWRQWAKAQQGHCVNQ